MMNVLIFPLLAVTVFGLPGYLWTRALWPSANGVARITSALLLGQILIGLITVLWVQLTHEPCSLELLLALSASCSLAAALMCRRRGFDASFTCSPQDRRLLGLGALIGFVFLVHYDRELFQFNCVNEAARQLLGLSRYGTTQGYPFATNLNVRLGNVALVGPSFVAFASFGPRWVYGVTGALIALLAGLVGRSVFTDERAVISTSVLSALNPYVFAIPINDENVFSWMLGFAILFALVHRRVPVLWLGIILGLLLGVRHIAVLVLPGIAIGLLYQRRTLGEWLLLLTSTGAVCGLWALHHDHVFGSPFTFESFREYHQDYPHSFLGQEFGFRGLLNWPFHTEWVRTPYNPYPTSILMIFWWMDRFGVLLSVAAIFGVFALRRTPLRPLIIVGYGALIWLQLSVLESWMQPNKMGIQLVGTPALILATVAGIRWAFSTKRRCLFWCLVSLIVGGAVSLATRIDVVPDERLYTLESTVRTEHPAYLAHERTSLSPYSPWPRIDRITAYSPLEPLRKISDLGFDLWNTDSVAPAARPFAENKSQHIRLRIDVSKPWVGRTHWIQVVPNVDGMDAAALSRTELPLLDWANLKPYAVVYRQDELNEMHIALEFGALAFSGDWLEGADALRLNTSQSHFDVVVPVGMRLVVTDVIADHFSRYYRWRFDVQKNGVEGSYQPRTVFTN